jgi:Bacterial Ig domain/Calx-beta domain
MKTRSYLRATCLAGVILIPFEQAILSQDSSTALPVLKISADPWQTAEPCPTCRVIPAVLNIERTEPVLDPLTVYLHVDGTATPGEDYPVLPSRVEIPAGETSIQLTLGAFDDHLAEGPEVVRVRVAGPPDGTPPAYVINADANVAMVVIGDDEPDAPAARLDIVVPKEGQHFPTDIIVPISAIAVWTEGEVQQPVEFYDGDKLIGRSPGSPVSRAPIPGWPTVHSIQWTNPPAGDHVLTARTSLTVDQVLKSPPVHVAVDVGPMPTLLGIATADGVASELSPLVDAFDPARFRIFRTGDMSRDLLAFFSVSGSATPGEDYQSLPATVLIPAGEASAPLEVVPIDDDLKEGMETVYVRLEPSPVVGPLPTYDIDPHHRDAVAVILDNEAEPGPAVRIVVPVEGASFNHPEGIAILAAAYDPAHNLSSADFYSGQEKIGESHVGADQTSLGGLFVHRFTWMQPPGGDHALTVQAFDENQVLAATSPPVNIKVVAEPALPVVRIEATQPIAEETSYPYRRLAFVGIFRISRTGPTNDSLPVFVQYSGLATPEDFSDPLPWLVSIPAGAVSTEIRIVPTPDDVPEGIETLVASISNCPPDREPPLEIPCYGFDVDPAHASATVFVRDDGITQASVAITRPNDGAAFKSGQTIGIDAVAIDLDGYISRVEFLDGDHRIGVSEIVFIRAPDPGTPIEHHFEWTGAADGPHVLTARAVSSAGLNVTSAPVRLNVGEVPPPYLVRIEATQPIAEEDSLPFDRIPFAGVFRISRTGPTDNSLSVFIHYSGTATPGEDYPALPWLVSIPAGADSTEIRVVPIADNIPEGIETLVAELSNCPPETHPPLGIPCYLFPIDPEHASATVYIRDDGVTEASVAITRPQDGAEFKAGQTIGLEAVAIDLEGFISRVEFWDGDHRIGVSEVVFIRPPDPGTPIYHHFEWTEASAGPHVLTARAVSSQGTDVVSVPVHITVASEANQAPKVAITHPEPGAQFPPWTPIEIMAETSDPDGFVRKVEFFADDLKIGETSLDRVHPPPPGETQSFSFVWSHPTPGEHALRARATDNMGGTAVSEPVGIRVTAPELTPVVRVVARDPFAVEPSSDTTLNTALFRIRRFGPTNDDLVVYYSLHGTAENGVDYELLPGHALLPGGARFVDVIVRPLGDDQAEGIEAVVLRLEEPPTVDPAGNIPPAVYRVGIPGRAVALISDHPWVHRPGGAACVPVGDGFLHVCFAAETGGHYLVEASGDLRHWESVLDAVAGDGAVHFVDDGMEAHPQRYYRLVPDPPDGPAP